MPTSAWTPHPDSNRAPDCRRVRGSPLLGGCHHSVAFCVLPPFGYSRRGSGIRTHGASIKSRMHWPLCYTPLEHQRGVEPRSLDYETSVLPSRPLVHRDITKIVRHWDGDPRDSPHLMNQTSRLGYGIALAYHAEGRRVELLRPFGQTVFKTVAAAIFRLALPFVLRGGQSIRNSLYRATCLANKVRGLPDLPTWATGRDSNPRHTGTQPATSPFGLR